MIRCRLDRKLSSVPEALSQPAGAVYSDMTLSRLIPIACCALAGLLLPGTPLAAQAVRGLLVEQGTLAPIGGASVTLVRADGERAAWALTLANGSFNIAAPPGVYRLRAERIGFATALSEPLELRTGETLTYRMEAPASAVQLEAITAEGERRCVLRPAEGLEVAALWEEARKALSVAARMEADRGLRLRAERFTRELEANSGVVRRDVERRALEYSGPPFAALPAAHLVTTGFAERDTDGAWLLHGPTAETLLSDEFLDTHCFRVVRRGAAPGQIGLGFEPVRNRPIPDIRGTLWLDEATAELRHLEYSYEGLDAPGPAALYGGRIEFDRLPSGAWYVRDWWIRSPIVSIPEDRRGRRLTARVDGLLEHGGRVLDVAAAAAARSGGTRGAVLYGVVADAGSGEAVAGASVYLSGTSRGATTDSAGAFRIEDVPPGTYSVGVSHPRLDSLRLYTRPVPITVTADQADGGQTVALSIAPPAAPRPVASAGSAAADTARAGASGAVPPVALEAIDVTAARRGEADAEARASGTRRTIFTEPDLDALAARGGRLAELLASRSLGFRARDGIYWTDEHGPQRILCIEQARGGDRIGVNTRYSDSRYPFCNMVGVRIDDVVIRPAGPALVNVQLTDFARVELLTSIEAGLRFGVQGTNGVLLLTTRKGPPPERF
jgi:hypothetical protein